MLNLIQIHLRTHRFFLLAWLTPLVLLAATSPGTYISSYPDEGSLAAVGASMRGTLGPVVLYGTIPEPFNYATWAVWETTSWGFILAAIMGLLLGSSLSRGLEESGQAELLQSNGLSAGELRRAALTVTILTSVLWGVLVAVSLWANAGISNDFTASGSLLTGYSAFLLTCFFGLLAILAGEAFGSVRAARQASFLAILITFSTRVIADVYDRPWLHWLTPFGWIRVVKPYQHDGNHWLPTMIFTAVLLLMSIPIIVVKRDLHSQWVRLRSRKYRAAGWGPWSLWWRLQGPVIVWWAVAIIFVSTGFFAMTGEMNSVIENSPGTAELAAQMVPDLQNAYAYMSGIIVGLIVCCMAIQLVLAGHKAEKQGLVTLILTTEQRRPMLFLQNFLYTMIATIITLIPAAFLSAYAAIADSHVSDDQFSTVVWAIIDLIAPAVACCGIAALCLAIRTSIIAWLVVATSGFLSFFRSLLKLDKWVLDLSVFAWAPHTVDHYRGAIVLFAIGLGSLLAGTVIFAKRDIVA